MNDFPVPVPTCSICNAETTGNFTHNEQVICESCDTKMRAYADKVQARIDRMKAYAERLNSEANSTYEHAHKMADVIPFGQPIHVGHYSERSDRNYRERIHKTFGRAFEKMKQAEELNRKAITASHNRAISSDDPAAILKLQEKLNNLEEAQSIMVEANKHIRQIGKLDIPLDDKIIQLIGCTRLTEKQAATILEPDYMGRTGFATWQLSNNSAEIRRVKARIEELQQRAIEAANATPVEDEQIGDIRIERNIDDNRIRMYFPGKPAQKIIDALKMYGFRWSPYNKAWQRFLNASGEQAVKNVLEFITKNAEPTMSFNG